MRSSRDSARKPIALFLPSLRGGGVERITLTLAEGLAGRGLEVDLVMVNAEGPYLSQVPESVKVIDLGSPRVLRSLPGLVRYLRRERPAAMLSAMKHANLAAIIAAKVSRTGVRLVIAEHSTLSSATVGAATVKNRILPALMRILYPWADAIVGVSNGVVEDLCRVIGLPRARATVIYNPVVSEALLDRAAAPPVHPWFEAGNPPVVLGAGRLSAGNAKDFPTLIKAFARLRAERFVRLMIIGEGEQRPALEALIDELALREDVCMPGFVSNPYSFMRSSAVFALSSRWEGLPTVLIEAMACGSRVVSTNCPSGPAEILEDGKWGRLVPVGAVEALADALGATLDEKSPPDVTKRAMEFSTDSAIDRYLEVLHR